MTLNFLIVENEPANRHILLTILNHLGHHVLEAASAMEAIDLLQTKPIDMVLLDVQMPHMDGLELLGWIRTRPETRKLPVICVSARATSQDQALAFEAGADGYVVKPFGSRDIIAAIARVSTRRSDP